MRELPWLRWLYAGGGASGGRHRVWWMVGTGVVAVGMAAAVAVTAIRPQGATPVHAQTPCLFNPMVKPTVSVGNADTTLFRFGQTITIQGSGYHCGAPLTLAVASRATTAPDTIQLTTDPAGSFQTSYAVPSGSLTGSPYPISVQVYDVYAMLLANLTLHSCQDAGINANPLEGCGPATVIQDSASYSTVQPLEQDAEQEIASLRGIPNDTTNVYFSRGEIRAAMLLNLLAKVKTCGQSSSTCASASDLGIVHYFADAVKQQRVDVALLVDDLYEGPADSNGTHHKDTSFCVPGTTSCGWYAWQHNPCSFLVPLGSEAIENGPNASDSEQREYLNASGCSAPCINPNACSAPQPSFAEFTGWAAAAMLEVQIRDWAEALMAADPSYTSLASAETQVQNEYIGAITGYREGAAFLTAHHATVPSIGGTAAEQDLGELWIEGFGDFEKDQFLDLSKAEISSIVEGILGEVIVEADEALISTSETLVPLMIAAVLTTSVGLYVTITQSQEGCELESALSAAQSDNLYNDVSGKTSHTDCLGNTVSMSSNDGLALLFSALMASTMPDFTNLRGHLQGQTGPSQVSDPVFADNHGSTNQISNTFQPLQWDGASQTVSISNGWFVLDGYRYQPDIEYRYNGNRYRAWIDGTNLLTELAEVHAGIGQVTAEVNLGCPGNLLVGANTTVNGVCVTPYPFPTTSTFLIPMQGGDQIEVLGQTRTVSFTYTNSLLTCTSSTFPFIYVCSVTGTVVVAPFNLANSTVAEVYLLTQPGPNCATSSSLGSRISMHDCDSNRSLQFDTINGSDSVSLHFVRAADDIYTVNSAGKASDNVLANDAPATQDQQVLTTIDVPNSYAQPSVVESVSNGQVSLSSNGSFTYTANSGFTANAGSPSCQRFPIPGTTSQGYQVCGGPTSTAADSFIYKLCYTVPDVVDQASAPTICSYAQALMMGLAPTLVFPTPGQKTYGDQPFSNPATSNSPGLISYITGTGSVGCSIDQSGLVTITGAATGNNSCILTASQAGSGGYIAAAPVTVTFHIAQAPLSVTASHADLTYGDAAPASTSYSYTYSGFVYQDTQASVIGSTAPACSTTYQQGNDVGSYAITCVIGTLNSPNYTFVSGYSGSDGFSGTNGIALSTSPVQLGAFDVVPARLTVTPSNPPTVQYSDPLPNLASSVTGFVLGQNSSIFTTPPTCSSTAATASFSNASGTVTTMRGVNSPAGTYAITCSGGALSSAYASDYTVQYGTTTLTVTQEDAQVQVTSTQAVVALPSTGSATIPLTATVWDSAANGYVGANAESGSTATIGDVTKMDIEFDIYQAGSCLSGTPAYTPVVPVSATNATGVGTANYTFSQNTPGAFCVVPRVVGATASSTNGYYTAPEGQVTGIAFYLPNGQFVTGGGWIPDAGSSNGHGNFGFEAHNNKNGPKGQFVYVWRGTYNGQAADFIIKSNALASLTVVQLGSTTYQATLQGKCTYSIVSQATGKQLYSQGNLTFIATVTDGDNGLSQPTASLDSIELATFQGGNVQLHPIPTTPVSRGDAVVHS